MTLALIALAGFLAAAVAYRFGYRDGYDTGHELGYLDGFEDRFENPEVSETRWEAVPEDEIPVTTLQP